MKKLFILNAAILIALFSANAQYQYSYGTDEYEIGKSFTETNIGIVIGGSVENQSGLGMSDAAIVDPSNSRAMLYGGSSNDRFSCIRSTGIIRPHILAIGESNSFSTSADICMVGTYQDLSPFRSTCYDINNGHDYGTCIEIVTTPHTPSNKAAIILGNSVDEKTYKNRIAVILAGYYGHMYKQLVIEDKDHMMGNWITQTQDGNFILTGRAMHGGIWKPYVAKLDEDLNIVWSFIYATGFNYGEGMCIREDKNGDYIVLSNVGSTSAADNLFMKINPNTGFAYQTLKVSNNAILYGKNFIINEEYYIVSGWFQTSARDGLLYNLKSDFTPPYQFPFSWTYDFKGDDRIYEVMWEPNLGMYYFTGLTGDDFYFSLTKSSGETKTQCEKEITLTASPVYGDFLPHGYPGPNITEYSCKVESKILDLNTDFCPSAKSTSLNQNIQEKNSFELSAYPSPASDLLTIEYPEDYIGGILKISDINGRKLLESNLNTGSKIEIPIDQFPAGLYVIRIFNNNDFETLKFQKQ